MDVFMQMMNYVAKRPYESPQVDAVSVALEGFVAISLDVYSPYVESGVSGLSDYGEYDIDNNNVVIQ